MCLYELLIRQKTGELPCEIAHIVSNREDLESVADDFHIPFHYFPIDPEQPENQVQAIDTFLSESNIDLVILARYMRILPPSFVSKRAGKIINIHHSFLPAFKGAKPYHQAWERGVKIIGATAHYVTANLDEGPILHQEAISVTHRHSIQEMIRAGRNLERTVLFEAVRAHLEHRVLLTGRRTIIFHF